MQFRYTIGEIKVVCSAKKVLRDVAALADKTSLSSPLTEKPIQRHLIGINPDNLSLSLTDVKDESGRLLNRLVINGSNRHVNIQRR